MKSKMRVTLFGLILALAFGTGAIVAWLGSDGGLSYTEPRANPSAVGNGVTAKGEGIAITAATARALPAAFEFADGDGNVLRPDSLRGKVVLINLWATWCPPCVAEMGALDALQAKLGGERFQVVAISLDRGGAPLVKRWYERNRINHLGVHTANPGQFVNAVLPTSILLDSEGRVAWTGGGIRDWEGASVQAAIAGVMGE
jgi:thiol-disulfide isomerase/thioredoxin